MGSIERVKELRQLTGAGLGDCRTALGKTGDDVQRAVRVLREMGAIEHSGILGRKTSEGRVVSYIHGEGRVGVLLQVDCESDFAARSDAFRTFAHEVCLQVAAMRPMYVSRDDVPADVVAQETASLASAVTGKPEPIIAKIVQGQLGKWYSRVCLLDQPWVKDGSRTVGGLMAELVLGLGENVRVSKFSRFEAGVQ